MTITWAELTALMARGEPDSVRGAIRTVRTWSDEAPQKWNYRIVRRGRSARVETAAGRTVAIFGTEHAWVLGDDGEASVPTVYPRGRRHLDWHGSEVTFRWSEVDHLAPTGPVESVGFLGRPAWRVELAAQPPHIPARELVVDAASGQVLRVGDLTEHGLASEWTQIEVGVQLADHLFEWDGPSLPPEDPQVGQRRLVQDNAQWLAAHGLTPLDLPVRAEVWAHEYEDDGAFTATVEFSAHVVLERSPRGAAVEHDPDPLSDGFVVAWSDEHWDWWASCETEMTAEFVAALKQRLSRTT